MCGKVKTNYGNKFMSNEQNQSDAKAHPVDTLVIPTAWLHESDGRIDVIPNELKDIWLKVRPSQVEHYTVPLYLQSKRSPICTQQAIDMCRSVGLDPEQNGNILKLVRLIEVAHGIKV